MGFWLGMHVCFISSRPSACHYRSLPADGQPNTSFFSKEVLKASLFAVLERSTAVTSM